MIKIDIPSFICGIAACIVFFGLAIGVAALISHYKYPDPINFNEDE
jgi:hypothetical protein